MAKSKRRPYVICHMVTTIDGKILSNRWGKTGSADLFETTAASFGIGAWLVGTTTMKEFQGRPMKLPRAKDKIERIDHIAQPNAKTLGIGADRNGVLRFQQGETEGDHVVLLVTDRVSNDYLAHLQKAGVSYLLCGKRDLDLELALRKLGDAFGLKKLMLQGGGAFNGAMLHAGLIDEISHLTIPIADGGVGVSSIFDIPADPPPPKAAATLRLMSRKSMPGGVTWVRYKVVGKPR